MLIIAHIGNIPVEEWLPFLAPVVVLYLFIRRQEHRRRRRVKQLLATARPLDERTTGAVLAEWTAGDHAEVAPEHIPLLYPPGPDGTTVAELATRVHRDTATVQRQLEDLAELGYVEIDDTGDADSRRSWLTAEGCNLVNLTEDALLAAAPIDIDPTVPEDS